MADERRKMLALNLRVTPIVKEKLDGMHVTTGKSRAAIVRALILRARSEDLPTAWVTLNEAERAFLAEVER